MQLLKYRMLFDKYIIKRDFDEKWSLLSLVPNTTSFAYNNSIGKDGDDKGINNQLTMILAMFHVSYPTMVYKHWLTGALKSLLELSPGNELKVAGDKYLASLEQLSDDFFYNLYGTGESKDYHHLIFDNKPSCSHQEKEINKSLLNTGTSVHNFVFNRLDYLLWKKLNSGYDFSDNDSQLDINYINERFSVFKFSFRTSVEHYFPQTNPWGETPMENVDRFGNLCLITPSNNAKLSNYFTQIKKKYYADKGRTESLKQAFMMSYQDWTTSEVGLKNIASHEAMMIKVLQKH